MNTYSRALRHINMGDVKQKHQQKLIEEKQQRKLEREEKKYIQSVMKEIKYDWRKELNEGMTSSGVFFTTLPAAGDVDLQAISGGDQNSFDPLYNTGIEFGASGNGSGRMGGFNIGANYLKFSQTPNASNDRTADTIKVDTSNYTTVTISAVAGNNSNGGVSPTANLSVYWFSATSAGLLGQIPLSGGSLTDYSFTLPAEARGKDIDIYFYEPDVPLQKTQYIGQSIPSLHPSTWNDTVAGYANNILSKSNPTTDDFDVWGGFAWIAMQQQYYGAASAFTWNAPGYPAPVSGNTNGTTQADRIAVGQAIYNAFGNGSSTRYPLTYGITNVGFRRVTPVNVFVPLDSPEATSFIRTEPNLSNLSPEEKNKKLREMLNASDEYLEKMLGKDFPGTGAVPPGEYEVPQPPTWEQAAEIDYYKLGGGDDSLQSFQKAGYNKTKQDIIDRGKKLVASNQKYIDSQKQKTSTPKSADKTTSFSAAVAKASTPKPLPKPTSLKGTDLQGRPLKPGPQSPVPPGYKGTFKPGPLTGKDIPRTSTQTPKTSSGYKINQPTPQLKPTQLDPGRPGYVKPGPGKPGGYGYQTPTSQPKSSFGFKIDEPLRPSQTRTIGPASPPKSAAPKPAPAAKPFLNLTSKQQANIKSVQQQLKPLALAGKLATSVAKRDVIGTIATGAAIGKELSKVPVSPLNKGGPKGTGATTIKGSTTKSQTIGSSKPASKSIRSSYEPQGQVITERKKLKSPEEVLNKIPGYYDGKPAPLGFPVEPPPEMVNGMHPDLVDGKKVANRFNRLDPESAKAMPLTGNPHIDKKVKAARKKPK